MMNEFDQTITIYLGAQITEKLIANTKMYNLDLWYAPQIIDELAKWAADPLTIIFKPIILILQWSQKAGTTVFDTELMTAWRGPLERSKNDIPDVMTLDDLASRRLSIATDVLNIHMLTGVVIAYVTTIGALWESGNTTQTDRLPLAHVMGHETRARAQRSKIVWNEWLAQSLKITSSA